MEKPAQNDQQGSKQDRLEAFRKILDKHRGESHLVVLQNYPDPDAIAAAFAHSLICENFEIEIDIIHSGTISHQQNIALVKLLEIELHPYQQGFALEKYSGAVLVDNQGTTSGEIVEALESAGIPVLIIVDHHELQERLEPVYSDIRRATGATATIYTEYIQSGELLKLDKAKREHALVATALFHGIMTDTGNFLQAGEEDLKAAAFLANFHDAELLGQIMSQRRSKRTMEIVHRAVGGRTIVDNYSIVGIGYLRAGDRDAIPQAADFLLTEEYIHTAIVYGIVVEDEEETLIGSLRTSKFTIDPDEFIKDVFGRDASGDYFGGGKISAGGFEIPIGFLSGDGGEEFREMKWEVYDRKIKNKLFLKIGVEPETDEG